MGNLFSRNKEPVTIAEDDQFFDCLNDADEIHEQNTENAPQSVSHYYAVWIPSNVETTGKEKLVFLFSKLKFILYRKSICLR